MRARRGRNKNLHVSVLKSHQKCLKHSYHVFKINEWEENERKAERVKYVCIERRKYPYEIGKVSKIGYICS